MSPPLPVPSKAAIHALRGIALGTSCAIGVIVEDRRRRISTLRTAVANKKKLKSSRQYHGTLDAIALQWDESILGGDDLHWHPRQGGTSDYREYPTVPISPAGNKSSQQDRHNQQAYAELADAPERFETEIPPPPAVAETKPSLPTPALRSKPSAPEIAFRPAPSAQQTIRFPLVSTSGSWPSLRPSGSKARPKSPKTLITEITDILASNDEDRLSRAVSRFYNASPYFTRELTDGWLEVSSRLSKECQAKDKWEDANEIISTIVKIGSLDESKYYAHDPLPVIEFHLRQPDPDTPCGPEAVAKASRLFLATFKQKPQLHAIDMERLGRQIIRQALLSGQPVVIHDIYWRVLTVLEDKSEFTGWALREFHKYEDHKSVIKYFLLNFSKTSPKVACFNKTINAVVASVDAMKGLKANMVFRAYARMDCPGNGKLRTRWVMKLLQVHWERYQDFAQSKELFDEVSTLGLLQRVGHPQGVYRTMVEIAIRADEQALAQSYFDEVTQQYPNLVLDIPMRGFFALAKAKAGDWDGVLAAFVEMHSIKHRQHQEYEHRQHQEEYEHRQNQGYDDAFIMILKVFAENHPVAEVRDFVDKYMSDLGVRMHRYMVTLVANKYGECHDMPGFMAWLEHCSKAGFTFDAGFCNSALHNCRTAWKLPYEQLWKLYSKIQQLNPDASDDVTKRILSQAAVMDGRLNGESTGAHRVRSKAIAVHKMAYLGRSTNKRDIYEAMNQELANGKYTAAVTIYKRAVKFGMPFCSHCLRLAVTAALQRSSNHSNTALSLIQNAHQQGHDVSPAVSAFIRIQIDRYQARAEDVINHMRTLISRFEALHIVIEPGVLTHMALVCVKLGRHEKAIALCKLAMDKSGSTNQCFSKSSIRVLLMAYSQKLDLEGMRRLLEDLIHSEFHADKTVISLLKSIRRHVQKLEPTQTVVAMLELTQQTIETVRELRAENRSEGNTIADETLRIMGDALAEMESNGQGKHQKNAWRKKQNEDLPSVHVPIRFVEST